MGNLERWSYLLERLEIFSQIIEEITEGENLPWNEGKIVGVAYWQRRIIYEI